MSRPVKMLTGYQVDYDRPLWLQTRRQGITATDIPAIVGESKWAGPLTVYLEKTGHEGPIETEAMRRGRRLEPVVLAEYTDRYPDALVEPRPGLFADELEPWRMATPDFLVEPGGVGEIKTGTTLGNDAEVGWGEDGTDEVPVGYLLQVTWQCSVMGRHWWVMPTLLDGKDFRVYRGVLDEQLAANLRDLALKFWKRHVEERVPPPADGLDRTREALESLHRAPNTRRAELPPEALEWAEQYRQAHAAMREAEDAKRQLGNLLRQSLLDANATDGYVGSRLVATWRRNRSRVVRVLDEQALQAAQPELYQEYCTAFDVERFRNDHPALAEEFTRVTELPGALVLRVRGE